MITEQLQKGSGMYVNMSNALVKAVHGLDIHEKRLIMLGISKLDSKKKYLHPSDLIVRLTVKDFIKEYDLGENHAWNDVKKTCEHIKDRYIRFIHQDTDGKELKSWMQWVGRATYKDSEGWVEIAYHWELAPLLLELKTHFTSYKLSRVGSMRSTYSWRLFELLMQWKKVGKLTISVDEFSNVMEAPESLRSNFSNLRIRVIEKAVREIKEKDGLHIKWKALKAGRKVKALEFTFPVEQQKEIPLNKGTHKKASTRPKKATDAELTARDAAADKAHMERLAALAGVPIEELLKGKAA